MNSSAAIAAVLLWIAGSPAEAGAGANNCITGGCHKSIVASKFLHGPVAAEEAGAEGCKSCHVPAGAACAPAKAGKFQLKTKQDRLCLLCHERGTATQHTKTRGNCLSCHSPHNSELSPSLLRAGK